jgi:hypothetical protein
MATKVTIPIPRDKIGESFVWRDWFQKLSDRVFGTLASQDASNVNITGGTITGLFSPLPIGSGGTNGIAVPTAYGIAYGTGTAYAFTSAGTAKQALLANTGSAPTWSTLTTGSSILYGDGSGGFSNVTIGSGVSFAGGILSATGSGGTVTSVSGTAGRITSTGGTAPVIDLASGVATAGTTGSGTLIPVITIDTYGRVTSIATAANPQGTVTSVTGTAPVVSSGGTTPAISLTTAYGDTLNPYASKTANYVLAAPNGSAGVPSFRALVAADIPTLSYVTSVSGTTGRITSTGGTTPVLDLTSGIATAGTTGSATLIPVVTIDTYGRVTSITTAANPQGTVTSVTGTSPVVSSGGATPAISMAAANGTTNGYLTSADWTTFNGKGSGSVTSVSATVPSFLSITGSPITTSGTLAISYSGTALPVANGGTGLTAGTSGGVLYYSATGTLASSALLTQYGVVYGGGAGAAPVSTAAGTTGQVLTATTGGAPTWASPATSGTVTSVSVVSANGFAGTVATATSTPAITLTTSITGILKGNGTAISAAVANTDYVPLATVLTVTADYTITGTDSWIINNKASTALTLTFPAASSWTGRAITVKNLQALAVNSASSNIVPLDSTTAGTVILLGVVGNWARLISNGTNWIIMEAAPNNILLLE